MTKNELNQCVMRYEKDLFSFCRYLTVNSEEANDLFQDTFLAFVEKYRNLDVNDNVKSYLLSIAVKLNKNRVRKIAWRNRIAPIKQPVEDEYGAREADDELPDMDEKDYPLMTVIKNEEADMIRELVKLLPEKYKTVILLFYMEELSTTQIAKVLRIPQGTVLSRLNFARKMLKERIEEDEKDNLTYAKCEMRRQYE